MMEAGGFDTVPGCFSDLCCLLGLHCHIDCNALYRLSFFEVDSAMCTILKVMVPKRLKAREWQVKDPMVFFFLMFYCTRNCEFLPSLVLISSFLLPLFLDTIDSSKMIVVLDLAELCVQKSAVDALCLGVELEKECEICLLHEI